MINCPDRSGTGPDVPGLVLAPLVLALPALYMAMAPHGAVPRNGETSNGGKEGTAA